MSKVQPPMNNFIDFFDQAISPFLEMGAYEALWTKENASFKSLAHKLMHTDSKPSQYVSLKESEEFAIQTLKILSESGIQNFGVRISGTYDYPAKLKDAKYPVHLLYYQGIWELVNNKCVAIVGTRNPSEEGRKRTRKLTRLLVESGYTIVSGLAAGIDTEALTTAIDMDERVIAVIGTPLNQYYPKENKKLQQLIASKHLLISQVPVNRYLSQNPKVNRFFFPERNITMSALTEATIIVEAGETSGTLHQARAAIQQGRKLFILESCFQNPNLTWPKRYEDQGAIRISDFNDLKSHLENGLSED